jgi:hypothetical protein
MITSSALTSCSNVLKLKLVPNMYSCIEVFGINVVLAALLPEETCKLIKQPQLDTSQPGDFEALTDLLRQDPRLGSFFHYYSKVVCEKICVTNDALECTNPRTVMLCRSLAPIYYPLGQTCEFFDIFCFFELIPSLRRN